MLSSPNIISERLSPHTVLVAGGGVAGMQAALGLAALDVPVLLVERNAHLGGQVMRLDKVYPTDHCAFCPTWSMARACYEAPGVNVLLHAELVGLSTDGERTLAQIRVRRPAVDPALCLFCGACVEACGKKALQRRDPGMTWDPALPPVMRIDASLCDGCGACARACPVQAVNLDSEPVTLSLPVEDVIYATGFTEPAAGDAAWAGEFGSHTHPDIFTAMEFEAWHGESRAADVLRTRSEGRPATRVAFVQCAGARDARHLPYCAAVCCMHAMKQARWLKRRQPNLDITLFYTDLRAPGAGQEAYVRQGRSEGIRLVRSRPGLIKPSPLGGIGVRYDDPATGSGTGECFDIVVVNGGLEQCRLPGDKSDSALRTASRCGFCDEPVDVAGAVIQGTAAAARHVLKQRRSEGGAA